MLLTVHRLARELLTTRVSGLLERSSSKCRRALPAGTRGPRALVRGVVTARGMGLVSPIYNDMHVNRGRV